jgi:hypothetical protein
MLKVLAQIIMAFTQPEPQIMGGTQKFVAVGTLFTVIFLRVTTTNAL